MRALEFGTAHSTHGLQCAVGTVISTLIYDKLRQHTPDKKKAIAAFDTFDYETYKTQLRALLGNAAEAMIKLEEKECKYAREHFLVRLDRIVEHWAEILEIIDRELVAHAELCSVLQSIGAATTPRDLGIDSANIGEIFEATRDIRDKYTVSRLVFDLGLTEEVKQLLRETYR
jgi:glycerol dehydrogenase-like iron-containing ADH family enzyme